MRTADELLAVVRVHADRVHDAVRRLGCTPASAVEVVEASALDLVEGVARGRVEEPVGWWFARARALADRLALGSDDVPLGAGVLAADNDQALLGRALDALPAPQRLALLLRDSYDLPADSVGTALGTGPDEAMAQVARARLAFLPQIDDEPPVRLEGHAADLPALARIAEGGPVAPRDATARKHAQACRICRPVVEAQDYAHRLLTGLVVAALPEGERARLLDRVGGAARAALPVAAAVATDERLVEEDDEPRRLLTPLAVLLGLVLAAAVGVGIGLLLVRSPGGISPAEAAAGYPLVTEAAAPRVPPPGPGQLARASAPPTADTRVFTLPTRTPPAPPSPSPEPVQTTPPAEPLGISLDPTSGPNQQTLTVTGTGWTPGREVTLTYLDSTGSETGSRATAVPDDSGRFTTQLAAQDPQNLPGPHEVRATDGTQSASATYDAQA